MSLIGTMGFLVMPFVRSTKSDIWHLFHGITLWAIWVERNDHVFNKEEWHTLNVKTLLGKNASFTTKWRGKIASQA